MDNAQTLMGLHWVDAPDGAAPLTASILFYSPMPGVASPGFNTLTRDTNGTWVGQGRLSRKQAYQWTGGGEETIVIEGRLYPNLFGGLKTMDRLRLATEGQRFLVTRYYIEQEDGGYVYTQDVLPGPWGVRRVRDGAVRINSAGITQVLEFSCELVMIGADAGDGTSSDFLFANRAGFNGNQG